MKRVYFVIVTSDTENFEETTAYATYEQAKKGLAFALDWVKKEVISYGFEDEMEVTERERNFTVNYSKRENGMGYYDYFFAEIVEGTFFEEGEEVLASKGYEVEVVTTIKRTYQVVAHTEEEAIAIAQKEGDKNEYYEEEESTETKATATWPIED